ncbi:MAG: hypothetical protein VZR11_06675 [Succinimonas sp.]|nr:hypothetical protein [Succinimonas sp.]
MIKLADYGAFLVTVEQYVSAEFRYAGTGSLPGTPKDIAWLEKTFGKYSTPLPLFRKDQRFGMMPYARFIPSLAMTGFLCSANPVSGTLDYVFLAREKKDCVPAEEAGLKCHDCRDDCRFPFFRIKTWKEITELPDMNYRSKTEWDFFSDDEYLPIICQLAAAAMIRGNSRLTRFLISYACKLPALGDTERIREYLTFLRNFRSLCGKTSYSIHYTKTRPDFGGIRFCNDQELLTRINGNRNRRARHKQELRSFFDQNPPEEVRRIAAESGIIFPEYHFKSEEHYRAYFRYVRNTLLNEQKRREDEAGKTSFPEDPEEAAE